MRFGLVGTGHWARVTHGPGIKASAQELVGVWGRDPEKTAAMAEGLGVPSFSSYASMLEAVDAVAFAVPPDVQAPAAIQAARAGKHLLLDKPVALDAEVAAELRDVAHANAVRSVVFFTARFTPELREWLATQQAIDGWRGAWVRWVVANQRPDSPYKDSAWRQREGALWDIGPHLLATVIPVAGDVTSLKAVAGQGDAVFLTLTHDSGMVTSATLSLFGPPAAYIWSTQLWGDAGVTDAPAPVDEPQVALAVAADELARSVADGVEHPLGLDFGVRVVEILAEATRRLRS
ncbi:Gfo/Idh/MocA family protein [Rudaeicoccus suwonensis]|uniref:Putative dehydrogenase n=1 Tax=Rudaeicoccus suwonensis TaxID=657409 RepID=A0A561E9K5_9MICO|nr:Gfo/Idh/MocA family oxidoreductase [Rudaeicoccus suwonensis]TWE12292.1 putative dehydrogenase [Rudaeicoccus suwonensis]